MSYQRMIPISIAVIFGVVNGVYAFKPYLDGKNSLESPDAPNFNVAPASPAAPSLPKQPTPVPSPDTVAEKTGTR